MRARPKQNLIQNAFWTSCIIIWGKRIQRYGDCLLLFYLAKKETRRKTGCHLLWWMTQGPQTDAVASSFPDSQSFILVLEMHHCFHIIHDLQVHFLTFLMVNEPLMMVTKAFCLFFSFKRKNLFLAAMRSGIHNFWLHLDLMKLCKFPSFNSDPAARLCQDRRHMIIKVSIMFYSECIVT